MRRTSVAWAWLVAALCLPAARAAAQEEVIGLPVGTTPKPVQVEDLDGNPVDLSEYIGQKPVLLEFWATWCPLCRALEPSLLEAHRRYGNDVAFVVLAVAVSQSKASVRRHLARHALPFPVLWDTNGNATRAFDAPSTSYVVVLDRGGTVVYTGLGSDQDLPEAVALVAGK